MKFKIMVVDDEEDVEQLIVQKFYRQIIEKEYEFVFAKNGIDALEKLQQNPDIEIVFSDINMPEMDGLTLLSKLNEKNPLLKVIFVSAYGDMDNIRTAMNRGAFDFICKPVQFQDLELTLIKTIKHVTQLKETIEAIKENNILRMYVDSSVLQFMTRSEYKSSLLINETIEGTVVFIDIHGFKGVFEKETADISIKIINKYFDLIVKEVNLQEGYIDKFTGDTFTVMAVFKGDSHINRAIKTSLAVQKAVQSHKEELSESQTFFPKIAIGMNSGEMMSGNIGSISLKRFNFSVVGNVVTMARNLKSVAKSGQILISKPLFEKIRHDYNCQEITDRVIADNVPIYEIIE